MKKLHDICIDEFARTYFSDKIETVLTGNDRIDDCNYFEIGKLTTFFSFDYCVGASVNAALCELAVEMSNNNEKKIIVFTDKSFAEYAKSLLEWKMDTNIEDLNESHQSLLKEYLVQLRDSNIYIENDLHHIDDIVHYLDAQSDIEAAFIEGYFMYYSEDVPFHLSRSKEDIYNFNKLTSCARNNNISIFLETSYEDAYTVHTSVHAKFEVSPEVYKNSKINVICCKFSEDCKSIVFSNNVEGVEMNHTEYPLKRLY